MIPRFESAKIFINLVTSDKTLPMKDKIVITEEYLLKERCFLLQQAPLNFFYDKEIYFTEGIREKSTLYQIVGNFGAFQNQTLENSVNVFVLSDLMYNELKNGAKPAIIEQLEIKLNSKGQPFKDLIVITEGSLIEFAKKRVSFYDDRITNTLIMSLKKLHQSFVAIDFETANSDYSSACEIGLVKVIDNQILDKYHSLIKPPNNSYTIANTLIHGITEKQTENAPSFEEIWPEIKSFIGTNCLVAHNINADLSILSHCLEYYGLENPGYESICTYKFFGINLDQLCQAFSIERQYHNALIDAEACAKVYIKYLNNIKPDYSKCERSSKSNLFDFSGHERIEGDYLKPDFENGDSECPFFRQKVVITGVFSNISRQEIAQMLKEKGADIDTSITERTNFLITGKDPGPSKIRTVETLIKNGKSIQLISEQQFLSMINGDIKDTKKVNNH